MVALVLWPALVRDVLHATDVLNRVYGADFEASLQSDDEQVKQQARGRLGIWIAALASPLSVLSVVVIPWLMSGTRPYQLGVTTHRLGRNVLLGVLAWLVLTPAVYGLYQLVLVRVTPELHPLTQVARAGPLAVDWVLIFLAAVVWAPLLEELLYRGLLQRFFAARAYGGDVAMILALAVTLLSRYEQIQKASAAGSVPDLLEALAPALFVLALLPVFLLLRRALRSPAGGAVFGTALLFAAQHAFAWPTPVPLFVLGLGLGYLAQRTQSLVGPVVLHALFNSVAFVALLLGWD